MKAIERKHIEVERDQDERKMSLFFYTFAKKSAALSSGEKDSASGNISNFYKSNTRIPFMRAI